MFFDLSDEEINLIKKGLDVQFRAYRDKFIESYEGKEHLAHATAEDPMELILLLPAIHFI